MGDGIFSSGGYYGAQGAGQSDYANDDPYDPFMYGKPLNDGGLLGDGQYRNYDPSMWGGGGALYNAGTQSWDMGSTQQIADVARYRRMGATASSPTQLDQTYTPDDRNEQLRALNDTRNAAEGHGPSAAELQGRAMIDNSIDSQMAMANSAHGGAAAQAAAQRQAAFQGAQTQQGGARDIAALRAQEMAQARSDYANQAGAIRGADFQNAQTQAQLDDTQRARTQQNQQYYEQLGWNTNKQAQDAWLQNRSISNDAYFRNRAADRADHDAEWGRVKDAAGFGGGIIGGILSDERAKTLDGYSGAYETPAVRGEDDQKKGGLLQAFSKFGGSTMSDERAKNAYAPAYSDERTKNAADGGVMLLYAPPGYDLQQTPEGHAYLSSSSKTPAQPSIAPSASETVVVAAPAGGGRGNGGAKKKRELTPEEMMQLADRYIAETRAESAARMAQGPAVHAEDPMAQANRSQEGSAYSYKPGFAEASGQAPGEMNYGPMAQNMASDPVASTAVRQDPKSGLLSLDRDKWQKLQGAGIASLQRQIDDLRGGAYYPSGGR